MVSIVWRQFRLIFFWKIEALPPLASVSRQRITRPKSIKEAAKLKKDKSFPFSACAPPTFMHCSQILTDVSLLSFYLVKWQQTDDVRFESPAQDTDTPLIDGSVIVLPLRSKVKSPDSQAWDMICAPWNSRRTGKMKTVLFERNLLALWFCFAVACLFLLRSIADELQARVTLRVVEKEAVLTSASWQGMRFQICFQPG